MHAGFGNCMTMIIFKSILSMICFALKKKMFPLTVLCFIKYDISIHAKGSPP